MIRRQCRILGQVHKDGKGIMLAALYSCRCAAHDVCALLKKVAIRQCTGQLKYCYEYQACGSPTPSELQNLILPPVNPKLLRSNPKP